MRTILRFQSIDLISIGASSRLHAASTFRCSAQAVLISLLFYATSAALQAGDFIYATNSGSITILGYTGGGVVTVPSAINGLPVSSIGNRAFLDKVGLTGVAIPDSVTLIGDEAFSGCTGLVNVTIPDSVISIGSVAFESAGLTNVTIGSSVTIIRNGAFAGCIGLTSVTIPNSVTNIWQEAFSFCTGLTSVTIGDGVTDIDTTVFWHCTSLTNITVDAFNPAYSGLDGVLFNKSRDTLIKHPQGKVGGYLVSDSVTTIGVGAFTECTGLTTVSIGSSVTSIGSGAFAGCIGLTNVTMENGVTSIGARAFAGCIGLKSAIIPSSVTNIVANFHKFDYAWGSFSGCANLTNITVDPLNATYSSLDGVLFTKSRDTLVTCPGGKDGDYIVPDGVTTIGVGAFEDCAGLTSEKIADSVTDIERGAFGSGLTSVTIGSGVRSIGDNAFFDCPELTSITIPDSVASIGNQAFGSCFGLTSVTLGSGVRSIGSIAFFSCPGLTSMAIPNSVTNIGRLAFSSCNALTTVTIGSGVTTIGEGAFSFCTDLRSVYFLGNAPVVTGSTTPPFGTSVFPGVNNVIVYYLPGTTGWGSTFAGRSARLWNPQIQISVAGFGVRSNGFSLNLTGTKNILVLIEGATNLATGPWLPLRVILTNGLVIFSDPDWTNFSARFYRAAIQ